ncbi:hypothetical protein D0Z00_000181 [Geotrichum galactomycetum]|uniref:Uncharacterized protein n=1 Tax=Geotrichum galactomycetum TaxID=27317 RepID=A0ACB6VAU3_9ASCO|nr:hypothetical protein D0Z00_000181 [Geotrichum candidum]
MLGSVFNRTTQALRCQQTRYLSSAVSVINPTLSVAEVIAREQAKLGFTPKAALISVTPQYADQLLDFVSLSSSKTRGAALEQVVGAAVDVIPYGAQRNGVSVLFSDAAFEIESTHPLDQSFGDDDKRKGRSGANLSSRGIVTARRTWHLPQSFLSIATGPSGGADKKATAAASEFVLPLANTLFSNGLNNTLVLRNGTNAELELLASVRVQVTDFTLSDTPAARKHVAPLLKLNTGAQRVTACKSNLLKTIDNKPAAGFLESCEELLQHKAINMEKKVFVALEGDKFYEVTAGGGGAWSPRASMLVIDNDASPEPGQSVDFYLALGVDKSKYQSEIVQKGLDYEAAPAAAAVDRIVLECAPIVETFADQEGFVNYAEDAVLPGAFGAGSEQGFLLNDRKYNVPGELLELKL